MDCHCKSRRDWELAPVTFNKLLILMLYFYSGDEYFLSRIVSCGDLTVAKDDGCLIKDEPCTIAKFLPG